LFTRLWEEQPKFIEKVLLINGDCEKPNLDLSAADEEFMVANMDIVIHCAATINLNGPLKHTSFINVRSTKDLLLIARRMHRLKVIMTAWDELIEKHVQAILSYNYKYKTYFIRSIFRCL